MYFVLTYRKIHNSIRLDGKYRLTDYKRTIVIFWLATALIVFRAVLRNSLIDDFYPVFNTTGIILSILLVAFIIFQTIQAKITIKTASVVKANMEYIYHYLPKTPKELRWFTGLSLSAGICEEIIFRLFLFEFLLDYTHISIALVVVNALFAITHIGSGKQNLFSSFFLGILFSTIYYFTNNIWIVITLHAAIDVHAGIIGYRLSQFERLEARNPAQAHVSE
ncbi:abortive infection bacteriophage resistance protein, Abi superfamily [Flammeovirgaceae bacterium 311]|nr:abortive infection bacteriophage resistance protein, Abi superfamily [Flammeovirgaceae bacterium 311]